jgi:hypothetical protein
MVINYSLIIGFIFHIKEQNILEKNEKLIIRYQLQIINPQNIIPIILCKFGI